MKKLPKPVAAAAAVRRRADARLTHSRAAAGSLKSGADAARLAHELEALQIELRQQKSDAELSRLNAELEERVLSRTAELTAINEELESFAYAVSHDLRAPLRAMSGFSMALLEDYGDQLPDEAQAFLQQIRQASQSMGRLIDGLLVLSRSVRGELCPDRVDLSALATRLCLELEGTEPTRRVRWSIEDGLRVWGDPRMLEVVMRNLLSNAWKYTAGREDPAVRVYAEREGDQVWHGVADNGVGFDMKHAARLFKPFQRLHRQDEFPGIGIGLATVRRVIHRHGGTIRATGAVAQGATFSFHLAPEPSMRAETTPC